MSVNKSQTYISLLETVIKIRLKNFFQNYFPQENVLINSLINQPTNSADDIAAAKKIYQFINQQISFPEVGIDGEVSRIFLNGTMRISIILTITHKTSQLNLDDPKLVASYMNNQIRWDKESLEHFKKSMHGLPIDNMRAYLLALLSQ